MVQSVRFDYKILKLIKNNSIYFWIIFIVMLMPIIIWTKSPIGVIPSDFASTYIGYMGSIVGGLLTLVGVFITIKSTEKQRQENIKDQLLPVLTITKAPLKGVYIKESDSVILFGHFTLFNAGLGPAWNMIYESSSVVISNNTKFNTDSIYGSGKFQLLNKNDSFTFRIPFIKIPAPNEGDSIYYLIHFSCQDSFHRTTQYYYKLVYTMDAYGKEHGYVWTKWLISNEHDWENINELPVGEAMEVLESEWEQYIQPTYKIMYDL